MCVACSNGQEILIIIPAAAAAVSKARSALASRFGWTTEDQSALTPEGDGETRGPAA